MIPLNRDALMIPRIAPLLLALILSACSTAKEQSTQADDPITDYGLDLLGLDDRFPDEASVRRQIGDTNVDRIDVPLGRGEVTLGTIIFPDDPARRLMMHWSEEKDYDKLERVVIEKAGSRWYVRPGITPGIRLDSLERLNGGPFTMLGMDAYYSGQVENWNGGMIGDLESEGRYLVVRFLPSPEDLARLDDEQKRLILGETEILSSHPTLQRLNPPVDVVMALYDRIGE